VTLVVFLRGVNVGGHRTFRPTALARELRPLDVVNIGAAGTFVVRRPVTRTRLRAELVRRLPFTTGIAICDGRDILRLISGDPFAGQPVRPDIVRFVSVLCGRPSRSAPATPLSLPAGNGWLVKILARNGPFVLGLYRRRMKVLGHLGALDRLFGVPLTTRNWNTIAAVGKALQPSRRPLARSHPPSAMWKCPECGRPFTRPHHPHSCVRSSVHDFLRGRPPLQVDLYRRFERMALAAGDVNVAPAKSRIGFQRGRIFAAVNGLSRNGLRIHIVTKRPIRTPRLVRSERFAADCHVNHFLLRAPEDLDDNLRRWLEEGYEWA
jgi:uncharacterized protein (DUF1697 family)